MSVQIIARDGEPEYAVLPWAEYQMLLQAAGREYKPAIAAQEQKKLESLRELKVLRERASLTLEAVAHEAGISPHYLAMIESGEREASDVIKRTLARALNIPGWKDE
ncbi:helix-turn-helix transcriptional regulator [Denitrificimonas sp. JX-1]|uniref:Helix-turn-helix transcriptional regulator n=1 Tax=Denitrificimonas halotolerans TaxID=3098930 RepID=A0ABU5GPJ7_9GAMM|nr:helix-turn-helix transcriptional regulator [Denitrificimonas sp. JX-1]MDY7218674.1 helix-turn-helix transcriptional regulator [Denitrificimonas sp. JX-1]